MRSKHNNTKTSKPVTNANTNHHTDVESFPSCCSRNLPLLFPRVKKNCVELRYTNHRLTPWETLSSRGLSRCRKFITETVTDSCHLNNPPISLNVKSSGPCGRLIGSSSSWWLGIRPFLDSLLWSPNLMGDRPGELRFLGADVISSSSRICRVNSPPISLRNAFDPDRVPGWLCVWLSRLVDSWIEVWRERMLGESSPFSTKPPTSKKPILLGVSGSL